MKNRQKHMPVRFIVWNFLYPKRKWARDYLILISSGAREVHGMALRDTWARVGIIGKIGCVTPDSCQEKN